MNTRKISAREAAFDSLTLCEKDGKYSNLEIDARIVRCKLEGAEKNLFTALVYGVIERKITLDYIIGKLSSRPIESLDKSIKIILRLGLYQIIYLDRVPDSAAVNESVKLAKKAVPAASAFVNAVLRGFLRVLDRQAFMYPDRNDYTRYLSVRYSVSDDVVNTLMKTGEDIEKLLSAFERQPLPTLRVNTLKITADELVKKLFSEGITYAAAKYSDFGLRLTDGKITEFITELIDKGYVYIQDEASQIATIAAGAKPKQIVIDTCACPGGKSFSLAILMNNEGEVYSFDLHKNKLSLVKKGADKLGITIIKTEEKNGTVLDEALIKKADIVLCDVPCSGLGVIAKKPEIRYKSCEDFERLPEIQYSIIKNSSNYVKSGGVLCYSTCTVNPAENGEVVKRFLLENNDFILEDFLVGGLESQDGMLTLYPHIHETDGFFVAKLRRK